MIKTHEGIESQLVGIYVNPQLPYWEFNSRDERKRKRRRGRITELRHQGKGLYVRMKSDAVNTAK